jgi:type VI secretion system protein ImpE
VRLVAEHYDAGRLGAAVEAAAAAVKSSPMDGALRRLLGQLLMVAGEFDRADQQFDTLASLDPREVPRIAPLRYLIRAAVARRDFHQAGALPEFVGDGPTPHQKLLLEAWVFQRANEPVRTAELSAEAESIRPRLPGRLAEVPFADFRDADDLLAGVFEVYRGGRYFWIAAEDVVSLEFEPPAAPLDLWARAVRLTLRRGPDTEEHDAHMPVVYASSTEVDDLGRLARSTTWIGQPPGPVQGVGQRVFALSEGHDVDILDLEAVSFSAPD